MKKKYLEIPCTFFDYPEIQEIESYVNGSGMILLWLEIFLASDSCYKGWRTFSFEYVNLDDETIGTLFHSNKELVRESFEVFEKLNLATKSTHSISVRVFWNERTVRQTTPKERLWRAQVLERDGHRCKVCGSQNNLQAHHIIPWSATCDGDELRHDINNGITLCRDCHLMAHEGNWKRHSGSDVEEFLRRLIERKK